MRILGTVLIVTLAVVVGLGVVGGIVYVAVPHLRSSVDAAIAGRGTTARFATAAPVTAAANPTPNGMAGLADPTWVAATAKKTGIPSLAVAAYAGAALSISTTDPTCGIGWNTVAAIGRVESRHGTIFGGAITANGDVVPSIYGISLDGVSAAHVPDSDDGTIDGDPDGDRAVGPMQMIPEAWRNWHVDGNGDGVENPQNIDDETLAAAHYLCRAGGDLTTEAGWRTGVLAYNASNRYLTEVIDYATGYATSAKP